LGASLGVARHTVALWRRWWRELFPLTPLWRALGARFMPPLPLVDLPQALLERFGAAPAGLMRLLVWLSPLSTAQPTHAENTLQEVR
jgi:hypothetical protein